MKNLRTPIVHRVALVFLLVAIGGLVACEQAPKPAEKPVLEKITTRLKWLPGATYIGSIVAKQAGIWEKLGLDVEVFPGGFEADPIKLVAAGSNDFGITGAEQLLQARSNGVPIVAIFVELRLSPAGWMALDESNIKKPVDFVGKKVGAQYGTNIEPTLDALLAKLNIDPKKLERIPVKYDVSPLFTGQVDVLPVYLNGQPVQARLEGHKVNTINPADYGIRLYGNVYFTSEKMLREKPAVVASFVKGLAEGWDMAITQPEEAVKQLVAAEPKLDPTLELEILKATIPLVTGASDDPVGKMSEERWRETKEVMSTYAGLSYDESISTVYSNQFIKDVYKKLRE